MCSRHQTPSPLAPKISCTVLCSGKIIWRIGKDRQVGKEAAGYTQGSRTVSYHVNRHVFYLHAGKDGYILEVKGTSMEGISQSMK